MWRGLKGKEAGLNATRKNGKTDGGAGVSMIQTWLGRDATVFTCAAANPFGGDEGAWAVFGQVRWGSISVDGLFGLSLSYIESWQGGARAG